MSRRKHKTVYGILISLALCSCATPPQPKFDVPQYWASAPAAEQNESAPGYPNAGWVKDFNDTLLTDYVSQALENNHDLKRAAAARDIARAELKKAGADLWPVLDLRTLVRRSGTLDSSGSGGFNFGGSSSFSNSNFSFGSGNSTTYDVSLDASWEMDVWGRLRSGKKAALYDYYAAENDYKAARQSLAAQTAKAYLLTIETSEQLDLAHAFEKNLQDTLDVTQAFYEEGLISLQDVHLVKADLARARESIRNAQSAAFSAQRSLEILLGRYPAALIEHEAGFPDLPAPVPAGIPAELLERRPDLIAAERRVYAAFQRTEQAKAARLPQISLTGSFGGVSDELRTLTDPANVIWSAAGNLLFPIFNAGRLKADVDIRTAEQESALAQYRQTALNAFSEVETALSNEQLFRQRAQDLDEAYENATQAEIIADENFKAGEIELLDLLQIKRSTIAVQIDRIRAQRELIEQRINLHLSLGGEIFEKPVQAQKQ